MLKRMIWRCGAMAFMLSPLVIHAQQKLEIANESLTARWNPETGRLTLAATSSSRAFLKDISLSDDIGVARVVTVKHKVFGNGRAIEVTHASQGTREVVEIYPKLPFALFRSTLANLGSTTRLVHDVVALSGTVDIGRPASELKSFGTGGLLAPNDNPGSYIWLGVVDPQTRNGVVFGWLTVDRGSGVVFSKVKADAVDVNARIDYGRLRIAPGKTEDLETLAVGYFDDARLGLEQWADAVAKVYGVHLKPQPTGYCTWYSQPHGGAADEQHLAELARFSKTNLAPFGFSVVQIDDKWQAGWKRNSPSSPKKDFTRHDPDGPYPHGMKAAADDLKSLGLVPGLWFMPFAGTVGDPLFDAHLDWFAKDANGKPYDASWGGNCLDLSNPDARAHVRDVTSRICRDWGFEYIKIDGLWTGTASKQLYVNSGYKEDDLGEATVHNPDMTPIEIYRSGLKLVREAAGKDVFILGCNAPQNMRSYGGTFGLVNGMRVGPDNKAEWKSLLRGPTFGSRHYFLHGRIWYNDPDPVYVRESIPLNHAQLICSWVALSGQLNLSSEWIPGLPPERLDVLKRTMPGHGLLPRPADLFDREIPSLWLVSDTRQTPRRDVIGIFNWESREQKFDYPLEKLGLDPKTEYVAFDFWRNQLLPSVKGRLQMSVPGESCVVIAVRPKSAGPQVISTSRHVTQGMIDLKQERWNARTHTLQGRSEIVGGDAYELRVVPGQESADAARVQVSKADARAGVTTAVKREAGLVRVTINSPSSREVNWSLSLN